MITQSQGAASVTAATAKLTQNATDLAAAAAKVAAMTADKTTEDAALAKAQADLATAVASNNTLLAQVAELQSELASSTATSPELEAALTALNAALGTAGTTTPPVVVPPVVVPPVVIPPTADDALIQAVLTDSSVAGMDARLGPSAPAGMTLPDVWTRPQVPSTDLGFDGGPPPMGNVSQGLSTTAAPVPVTVPPTAKPKFDFGSTDLNIAGVDDQDLVVNPSNLAAVNSDGGPGPQGVGVYRLRLEEHANGGVQLCPVLGWDDLNTVPDQAAVIGHTASYGMGNKLGRCIKMARARINRYDGGFGLYDGARGGAAYIGTMPTTTAWSPWSGEQLDPNFIPLCLGVSSQNEFLVVGVHDKSTGTGKLVLIVNWGGAYYNNGALKNLPFDFYEPHPGLVQSGVITGMKIIGTVDLPIKWPTSISLATSRNTGSDRIEGDDGNAAYLSKYDTTIPGWTDTFDISTQAGRAAFLAKNGGWIATWGKIVVASKYEDKVVQLDATALFKGYHDQYFTTQANYDVTRPTGLVTGNFWQFYDTTNPAVWPYMAPAWVPTVTRVLDVTRPTVAWMLETNDGAFVVGAEDGTLRWFKDDGTADGSLQLGANITSIKDDKYQGGVRNGYLTVVSRGARAVYGVWSKLVKWTIQDSKLLDPVDAGTADTHGIADREVWVLGFNDKKVFAYRNSVLSLQTQGGAIFGTGPTAEADKIAADAAVAAGTVPLPPIEGLEFVGSFNLPGHPSSGADSNVN